LDDREKFRRVAYTYARNPDEEVEEKLCDEERWKDLDSEADELYDMSEGERETYLGIARKLQPQII
jgi:hypothetical protein